MHAAMKELITMGEAFAAVEWVHEHDRHAGGAVQQPPSLARAAATKNVSGVGAMGETGKRRAKNMFQGAGRIKSTDWARALKTCQDEWEGCVPLASPAPGCLLGSQSYTLSGLRAWRDWSGARPWMSSPWR